MVGKDRKQTEPSNSQQTNERGQWKDFISSIPSKVKESIFGETDQQSNFSIMVDEMNNQRKEAYNPVGDFFSSTPSRVMEMLFGDSDEKSNFEVRTLDHFESKNSQLELKIEDNFPIENAAKEQPLKPDEYLASFRPYNKVREFTKREFEHYSNGIGSGSRLKAFHIMSFYAMARQKGKKYESIIYNTNINFLIHTLIL